MYEWGIMLWDTQWQRWHQMVWSLPYTTYKDVITYVCQQFYENSGWVYTPHRVTGLKAAHVVIEKPGGSRKNWHYYKLVGKIPYYYKQL